MHTITEQKCFIIYFAKRYDTNFKQMKDIDRRTSLKCNK